MRAQKSPTTSTGRGQCGSHPLAGLVATRGGVRMNASFVPHVASRCPRAFCETGVPRCTPSPSRAAHTRNRCSGCAECANQHKPAAVFDLVQSRRAARRSAEAERRFFQRECGRHALCMRERGVDSSIDSLSCGRPTSGRSGLGPTHAADLHDFALRTHPSCRVFRFTPSS